LEIEINRVANNESLSTSAFLEYFCGMNSLESKVVTATKWSALTEIASKLISPIAGMILARLLTPEAYGAVATTTIIISFAELFTDAGFQKYIIQHDFTDDDDRNKSINVAFWTNLVMSLIIWGIIIAFRYPIASLVGSPGLETAIVVACAAIPIAAFSSIQSAIYKRNLNFRIPFIVRMIGLGVTFFITIPLAFWLRSYWALIISSLLQNSISAIILTIYSNWRPFLFYEINRLKLMLSFCSWVILDSVLTWINHYLDLFIVSAKFDTHSLGIYKTSISTSNSILTTISAAIIPILLPTYAKMQNDIPQLRDMILKMQKYLGIIILPIGIITFLYSDIITKIFLGNQWLEASPLIGVWGIVQTFTLLVNRFCCHSYIALGKPYISVITSALYAAILLPTVLITCQYGYQTLFISRTMVKLWLLCVHLIATYLLIKLSPSKVLFNIMPELLGCLVMIIISYSLSHISNSFVWQVSSMTICLIAYSLFIFSVKKERSIVIKLWQIATDKFFKHG
jgi:PST family polysaccharide transporter